MSLLPFLVVYIEVNLVQQRLADSLHTLVEGDAYQHLLRRGNQSVIDRHLSACSLRRCCQECVYWDGCCSMPVVYGMWSTASALVLTALWRAVSGSSSHRCSITRTYVEHLWNSTMHGIRAQELDRRP